MGTSTEEQLIQKEREIEATRARLSQDTDELGDKLSPQRMVQRRTEAAKGRLSSLRERVMGTSTTARHSASSGSAIRPGASSAVDAAGERVHAGAQRVQSATDGNPLAAGLVAFGAGMVLSAMFPATEKEKQVGQAAADTVREHGQPLMDQAKTVGAEVAGNLKDQGTTAADEVRSSAQEAAENVKDEAQSSAVSVKDEARPTNAGPSGARGTHEGVQ